MRNQSSREINDNLIRAVDAIKRRDIHVGKLGLLWVLKHDPRNVLAWLWMSQCVEENSKKADCYRQVLKIDPNNEQAIKGIKMLPLEKLGDLRPNQISTPIHPTESEIYLTHEPDIEDKYEDPVEARLEEARKELLDLSLFNKLLNYRTLKSKGLEIIDEKPEQIFRTLVQEGRSMYYLPIPDDKMNNKEGQSELFTQLGDGERIESMFTQPDEEDDEGLPLRHTDNKLQTPYISSVLQKRLLNTYYAARTYMEEQGVNILFMTLGMLNWYESDSSEIVRKAPLILIPVELSRTNVKARFRINYTDDDLVDNLSLRAKLKLDFGIEYPELSVIEDLNIEDFFQQVGTSIQHMPQWCIDLDHIAIGFFSFGKFLMFNDLDPKNWSSEAKPYNHPILRSLLYDGFDETEHFPEDDINIDDQISPEQINHVVDADSSQSQAILDVNSGRNLVIQGPPGTGKSQTITNLIAESLSNGKTVLFISEKMAALEVVKRRLDAVGLGVACLELHSQKTKKKVVLSELRQSLELGQPEKGKNVDLNVLKESRDRLNEYSSAVNSSIGKTSISPYFAYGRLLFFRTRLNSSQNKIKLPRFDEEKIDGWSDSDYRTHLAYVEELQALLGKIGVPVQHPFWGCKRKIITPTDKELIQQDCNEALVSISALQQSTLKLAEIILLSNPNTYQDVTNLIIIAQLVSDPPNLDGVQVDSNSWLQYENEISKILLAGLKLQGFHSKYDGVLKSDSWNYDVHDIRDVLALYGPKWWRLFSSNYRQAKTKIAALCQHEVPSSMETQLDLLDAIQEESRIRSLIGKYETSLQQIFGSQWQGFKSDWEHLLNVSDWLRDIHQRVTGGEVPSQVIDFISSSPNLDSLRNQLAKVKVDQEKVIDLLELLIQTLELDESAHFGEGITFIDWAFEDQKDKLNTWREYVDNVQDIIVYYHNIEKLSKAGLDNFADVSSLWPGAKNHLTDLFSYAWYLGLIEKAMRERSILARFNGESHNQTIEKFCELDTLLLYRNRVRLAYDHWKSLPRYSSGGQLGILQREFAKKRRHLPIRKLINSTCNVIQVIKPVFMMSPLSIAMFLPPESINFDLVIFDEASQVKPVDSFGAILRGNQLVVVGDQQQLPPTVFFESAIDVDEDYSENPTIDLESILGLCYAQGIPNRMLRWHYRSNHESLINVSNLEFYNNKLVIFPSPDSSKSELGLIYHYLPDTEYQRGKGRANIQEARTVAEAVMNHAKYNQDLTLGVASFNISQMQAIQDQLEIMRRLDPSCESFFRDHPEEPFFVKNLENVQGDERDVIFISVGYGRTAEGKISMNFGPLNHEGGERRLNVLITRARMRCEVFTNLKSDDIDLTRTNAQGVRVLKRYLKYAETGHLEISIPGYGESDSPFEEAVADELRQLGYRVVHQVGSGGFFIDLAIVDEEHPGHFILGIECDGATYHSAKSARDRDRLRQEILENKLGWQIHRIWSTDWFQNPQRELQRIEKRINKVITPKNEENNPSSRNFNEEVTLRDQGIKRSDPKDHQFTTSTIDKYEFAVLDQSITRYKNNLPELSGQQMARWIIKVVDVEGPIHFDQVVRRILDAAGVTRLGSRIKKAFERGVAYAVRNESIKKQGDFLYSTHSLEPRLRSRESLPNASRKIELIAPEEISFAVVKVVSSSFGMKQNHIPEEVCRILGFSRVSKDIREHIDKIVAGMIIDERLINQGDYLVVNPKLNLEN